MLAADFSPFLPMFASGLVIAPNKLGLSMSKDMSMERPPTEGLAWNAPCLSGVPAGLEMLARTLPGLGFAAATPNIGTGCLWGVRGVLVGSTGCREAPDPEGINGEGVKVWWLNPALPAVDGVMLPVAVLCWNLRGDMERNCDIRCCWSSLAGLFSWDRTLLMSPGEPKSAPEEDGRGVGGDMNEAAPVPLPEGNGAGIAGGRP